MPYHYQNPGRLDHAAFADQPEWQRRTRKLVSAAEQLLPYYRTTSSAGTVSPVDFGGDPSGERDSTQAFEMAISKLTSLGGGRKNGANQTDLGGATLALGGGVYAISRPIVIPAGYANYRIEDGTIIAHQSWPKGLRDGYLLTYGGVCGSATAGLSKNCATDVSLSEVTLDGRDLAWGAVSFVSAVNVNVGPQVMVIGFQGVGIQLSGCGAGYVHDSWVGQYEAGDPNPRSEANATCILFDDGQHDSDLENVIIFSGKIGVNSSNGANRLQGVHTWNLAGSSGGTGILLHTGSGRVQDAYLDYAPLVVRAPQNVQVTGCLFLGSSTLVLAPAKKWLHSPVQHKIDNMVVTSNRWNTGNRANTTIILDDTEGNFTSLIDSVIEDNEVGLKHTASSGPKKGTRSTMSKPVPPGASAVDFDFSDSLLFSGSVGIAEARCFIGGPIPAAISTQILPQQTKLRVTLDPPLPEDSKPGASFVMCDVDQSERSCPAH